MAATRSKKKKLGPRRAASFVYAVLNPLIDALESEQRLLRSSNLTYLARQGRLEFIMHARRYVLGAGETILEDLEKTLTEIGTPISEHDRAIDQLTTAAQHAFDSIRRRGDFLNDAARALEAFAQNNPNEEAWRGSSPQDREEFIEQIAEWLVNRAERLYEGHRHSKFWAQHGHALTAFHAKGEAFEKLVAATKSALEASEALSNVLRELRAGLCAEYDLPYAPVAGVSIEGEGAGAYR
jgi:hypothetical protein